jgi:hypothetical protein
MEDQAFLRSFDSSPRPPPSPPLPSASCLSLSVILCVASQAYGQEGGRGWARSQIIYDRKKAWSPINYSVNSGQADISLHRMEQRYQRGVAPADC